MIKKINYFETLPKEKQREIERKAKSLSFDLLDRGWSLGEIEEVGKRLTTAQNYKRYKKMLES